MPTFSETLRTIRKASGLTQAAVAARIGTNEQNYQRYERGTQQPTLPVFIALANVFNTSLDYLAGLSNDPTRR